MFKVLFAEMYVNAVFVICVESHASAMSLLESGEQRYIKAIIIIIMMFVQCSEFNSG